MQNTSIVENDWQILLKMLPSDWKALGKSTRAIIRKFRNFKDEESVMRTLLLHVACGYSLRETTTRAKIAQIADVSDVALLKRLQCSELWFKELSLCLLKERGIATVKEVNEICMRLVDGTTVKEPGKTGSFWRIHFSLTLPNLQCDYFKLTNVHGKGTAESFRQFPVQKGDCIIGDRGYSTSQGIAYLVSRKAHALVRVNTSTLRFLHQDYTELDLLSAVKTLTKDYEKKEWTVLLEAEDQLIPGRLCVVRKSETSANEAIKKLKRNASRHQRKTKAVTEEYAKYIILFTTLPDKEYPLDSVLEWYRLRWQIELVFKRLKSIAGLGHLPKHDEVSARAWLYGKLFTGLLVDKLMHYAKSVSPWGYL